MFYDHNNGDNFVNMLREWAAAMDGQDEEKARELALFALGGIAQRLHGYTREVSTEVRAVLYALGHTDEATNICRAWITMMPDMFNRREEIDDEEIGVHAIVVGVRLHSDEPEYPHFEDHLNSAVTALLRAHGAAATLNDDGTIRVEGSMDHFSQHIENQAAEFAEEIDQELGDSTTDNPGERKWW